jgi:hypothetical protein
MIGVKEFEIPKDKAYEAWKEHLEILKKQNDEGIKILKDAYYHASKSRKIIDIYQTMESAGLDKEGWPRLAICRADGEEACFQRREKGGGLFHHEELDTWGLRSGNRYSVRMPAGSFMDMPLSEWPNRHKNFRYAIVPTIPAAHFPKGKLERYYILWEVEQWHERKQKPIPPIDPFLLKRLSRNLFAVIAEWDLTPLERAVIRGAFEL